MVKIKEGYVMNAREKMEFDRVNALPRKKDGRVDYYYKPQTKYPPRIYVYMHAEIWCDRNRRPMGLFHAIPFLTRPMNQEEIEYHHFDIRLCYHQYEDWNKLIYAEEQEADELDKENPGSGAVFLDKLKSFRERCPIGKVVTYIPAVREEVPESEERVYMRELISNGQQYTVGQIGELLKQEQQGEKRPTILILLRELYKNKATGKTERLAITAEQIERKAFISQERTRRNTVRRVYKKNPLFALEEIRTKYPDYSEGMLPCDLMTGKIKVKKTKCKPVLDLRRCQLKKLTHKLLAGNLNARDYQNTCCRIVMLQNAHNLRLPIPLTVTLNRQTLVYAFNWRTRETVVKSFVELANTRGMTHEELGRRYKDILSSNYSY
ncbi:hypothetical protein G7092_17350 [Mucilaginibacter sp. HC2]|uniref:hypothetical protein n=1 Tax=Mucilaginibacter TaxID=423349 RepID=UPI00101A2646|nr:MULTISPECIES: hypothetical protein [Mucilaginibacter]NHA05581.1 hypothetical protein [Mucilaginibacter inviolabilis]QTE35389.1 hypothetical protein J3L18_19830 [Mucilaginibacter gossypii]